MKADALDVGNLIERSHEGSKAVIRKRERISPAEDAFGDGRVCREVVDLSCELCFFGFVRKILTKAVSTMHGTGACCEKESPAFVFMQEFA